MNTIITHWFSDYIMVPSFLFWAIWTKKTILNTRTKIFERVTQCYKHFKTSVSLKQSITTNLNTQCKIDTISLPSSDWLLDKSGYYAIRDGSNSVNKWRQKICSRQSTYQIAHRLIQKNATTFAELHRPCRAIVAIHFRVICFVYIITLSVVRTHFFLL